MTLPVGLDVPVTNLRYGYDELEWAVRSKLERSFFKSALFSQFYSQSKIVSIFEKHNLHRTFYIIVTIGLLQVLFEL